jgi:hypothetical protein
MRRRRKVGLGLLGVAAGLCASEGIFRLRDHAAFPHLNVYESDADLAVRLRPGATENVAFNGNPLTSVRIGPEGFRGAGLPKVTADEIIVLGDSQVFGLGVEENETFSAALQKSLGGRAVLNAGVPTYGPYEYLAVARALLESRHPKRGAEDSGLTVVYVINMANDLFEAAHRNVDRHAVWDGWAVRKETAPDHITSFPGRELLYRDSHLFYALRGISGARSGSASFASEGSWKDLVALAQSNGTDSEATFVARKSSYEAAVKDSQLHIEKALTEKHPELVADKRGKAYMDGHGTPGDIVEPTKFRYLLGEEGRAYEETVQLLVAGAEVRRDVEARIRAEVERERKAQQKDAALLMTAEEYEAHARKLDELLAAPRNVAGYSSPMAPHVAAMKALTEAHGARLLVVALPLDVQTSADEWKKYGVDKPPMDVASTRILSEDIVEYTRASGVSALDPTPALQAAEPGAFLIGDLHMSPRGHQALATAIAAALREPPPIADEPLALPRGRSRPPTEDDWKAGLHLGFFRLVGEDRLIREPPLDCHAAGVREWVRLVCKTDKDAFDPWYPSVRSPKPVSIASALLDREVMTMSGPGFIAATAPVPSGARVVLNVAWETGTGDVSIERKDSFTQLAWKRTDLQLGIYDDQGNWIAPKAKAPVYTPLVDQTCACHAKVTKGSACDSFPGAPDADCARTYPDDCEKRLRCEAGDPFAAAKCQPGERHAGPLERCYQSCDKGETCNVGACKSYQGVRICM